MYPQQYEAQYNRVQQRIEQGEKLRVTPQRRSYLPILFFVLVIIISILISVLLCQWMFWAYKADRGLMGSLITVVCFLAFDVLSAWILFARRKMYAVYRFKLRIMFAAVSALITIPLSYMLWAAYYSMRAIFFLYIIALCANLILNLVLKRHRPRRERPWTE